MKMEIREIDYGQVQRSGIKKARLCKYCGVPKIEQPCQDCNNNHFYQFLGVEGDEDCFEEAKDINSKIIDS